MPISPDIYDDTIKTIYVDMIEMMEVEDDNSPVYHPTEDTWVHEDKKYYEYDPETGEYTAVPQERILPNPKAAGYFEWYTIRLNSSGNRIYFGHELYIPATFELVEPDRTSVNEESGSLNIVGVTNEYVQMIQYASKKILMRCSLIRYDEVGQTDEQGNPLYIIDPIDYEVSAITIDSKNAALSVSLKGGGILGFYASKDTFSVITFPGLCG